jgi:hypothetical protein
VVGERRSDFRSVLEEADQANDPGQSRTEDYATNEHENCIHMGVMPGDVAWAWNAIPRCTSPTERRDGFGAGGGSGPQERGGGNACRHHREGQYR